jgi:hypothetical protein
MLIPVEAVKKGEKPTIGAFYEMTDTLLESPILNGHPGPSRDELAVTMAATVAAMRHIALRCPHVLWPPEDGGGPAAASLSTGVVTCPDCIGEASPYWRDDGCCELCERPTDSFTAHFITLGEYTIGLELCEPCTAFFRKLVVL